MLGEGGGGGNKNLVARESTRVDFSRWGWGGGGGEEIFGWWGGDDSPSSITLISVV